MRFAGCYERVKVKNTCVCSKRVLFFEYINSNEWRSKVAKEFYDE